MRKLLLQSLLFVLLSVVCLAQTTSVDLENFENGHSYRAIGTKLFYYVSYDPTSETSLAVYSFQNPVRFSLSQPAGEMSLRTVSGNMVERTSPFQTTSQIILTRGQILQLRTDILATVPENNPATYQLGYVVEEPLVTLRCKVHPDGRVEFTSLFVTTELGRAAISNLQRQKLIEAIDFYLLDGVASSVSGRPTE